MDVPEAQTGESRALGAPVMRSTLLSAILWCAGVFIGSILMMGWSAPAAASPLSARSRAQLAANQPVRVIVEFDATAADTAAASQRARSQLNHDTAPILALRAQYYAASNAAVAVEAGADAQPLRNYKYLPLSVWQLSSLSALDRLLRHHEVRAVHEDLRLHAATVSDLPFIEQPQAQSEGAIGSGTTIAIIDGGLGTNYTQYGDFSNSATQYCTGVNAPQGVCRVVYNVDYYPGASSEVAHGTNVSAIALGVAPGADLAMFNVFDGTGANASDILTAMNTILQDQDVYNYVATNLSLSDGSSNPSQCSGSVFAAAITSLSDAGILSVAAAGNSGSKSGLGDPACVPGIVSVGAVYNGSYGTIGWGASADSGGVCTDSNTTADTIPCFSQSANYLTVLAPGTFVNAPNSSFQFSGTSQATPHVTGSVAVLRSRYPAEPISQTVQRLQSTPFHDTDSADGMASARIDLQSSVNEATGVALSGSGPTQATQGTQSNYSITVTNGGPLVATNLLVTDNLPSGATFVSASSGCTDAGSVVSCRLAGLGSGSSATFTITVKWNTTGAVYDTAQLSLDQIDSDAASQQQLAFGTPSGQQGSGAPTDGPMPLWALVALGAGLVAAARQRLHRAA